MNLNKTQLPAITSKIVASIKEKQSQSLELFKEKELPKLMKDLEKTKSYKFVDKTFKEDFISKVCLKNTLLKQDNIPDKINQYSNLSSQTIDSLSDFKRLCNQSFVYHFSSKSKEPNFDKIYDEVVLENIGCDDLEGLINKIVNKY